VYVRFYRATLCYDPVSVCVCLSVTSRCSINTAKHRITQTKPHDSPGTLVFFHAKDLREIRPGRQMQSRALFLAHHADYRRRRELLMSLFISSTLLVLRRLFTVCHMPVPLADWIISGPFRRPTTKNAGYKISLSPPQCACWGVSSGTLFNPHINLALCVDRQCVVCPPPYPLLPSRRTASSLCFPRYRKHPLRNAMSTSPMQVDRSRCIELRRRRCDKTRGHVILTASKSPTDRGPDGYTTNERRKCRTETCTSQACIRQQYYLYFTGLSSGELAELARHLCR